MQLADGIAPTGPWPPPPGDVEHPQVAIFSASLLIGYKNDCAIDFV
jgi:hypothetical protein